MDCRKICKMKFVLLLLSIQTVASSEVFKHAYTKSYIKRLEENNRAYNPSKKTAQYGIFRPTGNSLSFQEIVESYQAVNNRLASNTMLTIITIRKRNRNIPDDKNANMSSFITALQKYGTDFNAISFVVNNMIVTINSVEQSYLPGLCMIRNTSEQIRQAYVKLNLIFIDTLPELLFKTYLSWMIDRILNFIRKKALKKLKLDGLKPEALLTAIDAFYDKKFKNFLRDTKNQFDRLIRSKAMRFNLCEHATELKSVYLRLQKYEEHTLVKYLTTNKEDFESIMHHLIHKIYKNMLIILIQGLATIGFSVITEPENEKESKNAFKAACMLFVADMGQDNPINYSDSTKSSESNSTESLKFMSSVDVLKERTVYSIYRVYFERIGFESLQASFLKSKKDDFERLRKRLAYQDSTKIVIEGKYSNDDIYSLCSALDSANAFSELDKCQAMYLYKEKAIEVGSDDAKAHECESYKLRPDTNTSKSVLADGTHKTSAIDTVQECDNNAPIQNKYSLVISVAKKNVTYSEQGALRIGPCKEQSTIETANSTDSMPEEVKKLLSQCLDKSNRKSTELCEITVESKHFVSHVHILNYISIDEKEITSLIYDIQDKGQMTKGTSKENLRRSFICLDDVPIVFIKYVLNDFQNLQLTDATEFKPSNIITAGCERIIYTEKDFLFKDLKQFSPSLLDITEFLDTSRTQNHYSHVIKMSHIDDAQENFPDHFLSLQSILRHIEYDKCSIDTIICQLKQNINFIQREFSDPCVINRHKSSIYIACYTTCEPDKSYTFHVCVSHQNDSVGTSVDYAVKTLCNVLNDYRNELMIATVDLIEKQMMLKQKIIPTIIDNMCRQKYFDVKLSEIETKKNDEYIIDILQNIESLFEYSDEWAKANTFDDRFFGEHEFFELLKVLIEQQIERIVDMISKAALELKNNRTLRVLSFKAFKGATLGGSNALVNDTSCKNDVIYANLKHLEASEEHFTKNKNGIYKCL